MYKVVFILPSVFVWIDNDCDAVWNLFKRSAPLCPMPVTSHFLCIIKRNILAYI